MNYDRASSSLPTFRECVTGEVRRIYLPRTPLNKGKESNGGALLAKESHVGDLASYDPIDHGRVRLGGRALHLYPRHPLFVDHVLTNGDPVEYFAMQSRASREQLTVEVADAIATLGHDVALPVLE